MSERVLVPIRPRRFPTQGASHCGAYAVLAVLSAYGVDDTDDPVDLHTHPLSRLTGSSTSMDYYPGILRSYGLVARARTAHRLPDDEKIELLKGILRNGSPIILSVANHFHRRTGRWQPLKGLVASHWVSLWGYDDGEKVFYTYDSLVGPELADEVPVGNKKRSYSTLLQVWPGSMLSRMLLGQCSYIYVEPPRGP